MNTKKLIIFVFLALISACIFLVGFMPKENYTPKVVYQVYLEGEKVGLVDSKEELENYIDNEQSTIKKEYNVDTVYVPNGLEIKKVITYSDNISTSKEIYEKIKDLNSFTIKGYSITLKEGTNKQKIYVLDKKVFEDAVDRTVKAFVDAKSYEKYLASKQIKISSTGTIIEDVTIGQEINIKNDYIPTNKKIFTSTEELTKYLLYGNNDSQQTYTVKEGDIIADIAFNNKLSTEEFLVANPEFSSADVLLLAGQTVNVGLINPQIDVMESTYIVKDEVKKFNTEITYDSSLLAGVSYTRQAGSNGLNRVTQRITQTNGEPTNVTIISTEELSPTVNEIVVKGDKYVSSIGINGYWYWPTTSPYMITTYYGYRWGSMHPALDIAGCGYGSPIYAANNGTIIFAAYSGNGYGNYIIINHNNGWYTQYGHLAKIYVKVGQNVQRGQVIGGMGNTGYVVGRTGIHLHYGMWRGGEPGKGVSVNPLKYY